MTQLHDDCKPVIDINLSISQTSRNGSTASSVQACEIPGLAAHHYHMLHVESGISDDVIRERGYRTSTNYSEIKSLFISLPKGAPSKGLLLPLCGVNGKAPLAYHRDETAPYTVFRPDVPVRKDDGSESKYLMPFDNGVRIDCPPRCHKHIDDPSVPLWITEGQKKADALASHGACAIALLGVWNFRGKNAKGGRTILSDWQFITLKGREVRICYDSDVMEKEQVKRALDELSAFLKGQGARVHIAYLPSEDGAKVGVDDYLLTHTMQHLERLLDAPQIVREERKPTDEFFGYLTGTSKPVFIPKRLADTLMQRKTYAYTGERLWRYKDGVYVPDGEQQAGIDAKVLLGEEWNLSRQNQSVQYVAEHTALSILQEWEPLTTHINLQNGLLDWRTGELLPHSKTPFTTSQLPFAYNNDALCPTFDTYLSTTFPDTQDMPLLIDELLGWCMVPLSNRLFQVAVMLLGAGGDNGKSTFLDLIESLLGRRNVSHVSLHDFDGNRFRVADLYGKLANLFDDVDKKDMEQSGAFKIVSAGGTIQAERKNKDTFDFTNYAKLIFSANDMPKPKDDSEAFYKRWIIIPFDQVFRVGDRGRITDLHEKLAQERPGILNRAVAGLQRLIVNGKFSINDKVQHAKDSFIARNNTVSMFAAECLKPVPSAYLDKDDMRKLYKSWCIEHDQEPVSDYAIKKGLEKFCPAVAEKRVNANSPRYWIGLACSGEARVYMSEPMAKRIFDEPF